MKIKFLSILSFFTVLLCPYACLSSARSLHIQPGIKDEPILSNEYVLLLKRTNEIITAQRSGHDWNSIKALELLLREHKRQRCELEENQEQLVKKYEKPSWLWRFLFEDNDAKNIEEYTNRIEWVTNTEQSTWKLLRQLYAFRALERVGFWLFE